MIKNNNNMKIIVSGKDCTEKLASELSSTAQAHNDEKLATRIERERPILDLRDAVSEDSYLDLHEILLRDRNTVDPTDYGKIESSSSITIKSRLVSSVQKSLWKLLRYQHDWIALRSNAIIAQLTYQLEFEIDARKKLEEKVDDIEKKLNKALVSQKKGENNV